MPSYVSYKTVARDPLPLHADETSHVTTRTLVRRNSTKRLRPDLYDDEDDYYEDYPPYATPTSTKTVTVVKPSHYSGALVVRQPTTLEKFNVFNNSSYVDDAEIRDIHVDRHRTKRYHGYSRVYDHEYEDERFDRYGTDDVRDVRVTTVRRPSVSVPLVRTRRASVGYVETPGMCWDGEVFRRGIRDDERREWEWEMDRREREREYYDTDDEELRLRRRGSFGVRRTKTLEWKPLVKRW